MGKYTEFGRQSARNGWLTIASSSISVTLFGPIGILSIVAQFAILSTISYHDIVLATRCEDCDKIVKSDKTICERCESETVPVIEDRTAPGWLVNPVKRAIRERMKNEAK